MPISIHISESRFEIDYSQKNFGTTPVKHLEALGFFEGTDDRRAPGLADAGRNLRSSRAGMSA